MNRGKLELSLPCGKKATIIPIHKKGKDKKNPNSYQPISLLSCLGKLLEKVINRRLLSFLEDNNVLSQTQTGYRKHRNTEDQLALIAEERECIPRKEEGCRCLLWYDKSVWQGMARGPSTEGTPESGIRENVQMDPLLSTRQISKSQTRWEEFHKEVSFHPHSCTSTTLQPFSQDVSNTLHADDCAVWSAADHTTSAAYRIRSCHKNTAVDRWVGSSDQQNKDPNDSFLSSNSQGKDHSEAWRQNTTPSRNTNFSRSETWSIMRKTEPKNLAPKTLAQDQHPWHNCEKRPE